MVLQTGFGIVTVKTRIAPHFCPLKNETRNEPHGAIAGFLFVPWELYRTALNIESGSAKRRIWFTAGWIAVTLTTVGLLVASVFV